MMTMTVTDTVYDSHTRPPLSPPHSFSHHLRPVSSLPGGSVAAPRYADGWHDIVRTMPEPHVQERDRRALTHGGARQAG
jgi:hypothetical protein